RRSARGRARAEDQDEGASPPAAAASASADDAPRRPATTPSRTRTTRSGTPSTTSSWRTTPSTATRTSAEPGRPGPGGWDGEREFKKKEHAVVGPGREAGEFRRAPSRLFGFRFRVDIVSG
ncbi:hypothetical protein THAOC_27177, partial [Thalassiosira oceanica]